MNDRANKRTITLVAAALVAATAVHVAAASPPHSPAQETCQLQLPNLVLPPPSIYAADVTAQQDWQYVAWRPNIWYWNGSQWALAGRGQWLWSWAFDSSPATYWYDFNDRYVGTTTQAAGARVVEAFNITGLGYYYLISNEFYWYASNTAPSSYTHEWASDYAGNAVYNQFCFF